MSYPSSAMCCTYGTPLMMPLQFQDWTQTEETNGEDIHITVVTDLLGFISDVAVLLRVRTSLLSKMLFPA